MHLPGVVLGRRQELDTTDSEPPTGSSSNGRPIPSSTLSQTQNPISTNSSPTLAPRDSHGSMPSPTVAIVIGTIAAVLGVTIVGYITLRQLRLRHKNPKYIPTLFLKRSWENWEPTSRSTRLPSTSEHLEPISDPRTTRLSRSNQGTPSSEAGLEDNVEMGSSSRAAAPATTAAPARAPDTAAATTVDRNTSVRSVMTLPAYNPNPLQHEQILAREGERGGIDIVIEFPETVDEEERSRQQEMDALYQVRLARRRENEEREERRTLRREARERGDYVALRELQERARASSAASTGASVDELRAEHERIKKERQRTVSSVSYADLGVARHDGTRIRANSVESEREGLLGDAASIAASSRYHRRDRSASSVLSIDTTSDLPSPGLTRPRAYSRPDSPARQTSRVSPDEGAGEGRAGSSPEIIDHDDLPPNSPPGYENVPLETSNTAPANGPPPDYTSPVFARGEHREMFPSIDDSETRGRRPSSTDVGRLSLGINPDDLGNGHPLSTTRPVSGVQRTSRGVGGTPQLPSLRLRELPSIEVAPASPTLESVNEGSHHPR